MLLFLYLFIFCIVFRADKWYGKYGILPAVAVPTDTGVNTGVGCGGCDAWHVYIYEDINININGAFCFGNLVAPPYSHVWIRPCMQVTC